MEWPKYKRQTVVYITNKKHKYTNTNPLKIMGLKINKLIKLKV